MPLTAGIRFGDYEILAPIGAGGMGEVYRARDTKLKRDVALKVLPEVFARDPGRMLRFQREAEVLASLNHPNIAHIYGVEERALVMELVEGESPRGPLPFDDAWKIAVQIADALEYAHERGVIHRDLKPANVKVTPDGVVKLLDFGLAKAFSETPDSGSADPENSPTITLGVTVAGTVLGTAAYMSPEQAKGKKVDKRADIWSWGVVLYELLTGERLFKGGDATDTLAQVLTKEPPLERVPTQARRLLAACLQKDPKQRLRDIGDAKRLLVEKSATAPARSRLGWVASAMFALVAAGLGWIAWRTTQPVGRPLMQLSAELGGSLSLALPTGGSVALSPNGTLLALIVRGADGQTHLATRRIDQSQINVLPGTEGAQGPFFSPDGRWIAFSTKGALKKIAAQGGAPVLLYNAYSLGGSWGDDGFIVAVLGIAAGLTRLPETGGMPTPITQIKPGGFAFPRSPQVLPGSEAVLFTNYNSRYPDETDIVVVSLKTGKQKMVYHGGLFARYLPSGHLVFIRQNTLFAAPFDLKALALKGEPQPVLQDIGTGFDQGGNFDFSQTGTFVYLSGKGNLQRSIFWLDSAGRLQPLVANPGIYSIPRFSPDGKHLAWQVEDGQGHSDIYIRDLEQDRTRQLTSMPGRSFWPVWTHDSRAIIFEANSGTSESMFWMRSDGSGQPQKLADFGEAGQPTAVSPDGKWLAFMGFGESGGVNILTAPIEGDPDHPRLGKIAPFVTGPSPNILPKFSPDGRWVAYMSGDPGNRGILVRAFPGPGGPWTIDSQGAFPSWSHTGREMFYLSGARIMVTSYTANGNAFEWTKPRVWSEKRLLDVGAPPYPTFDIAPEGKRAAVVLYADGTAEEKPVTSVTFLLNFFDYLRQRVPVSK